MAGAEVTQLVAEATYSGLEVALQLVVDEHGAAYAHEARRQAGKQLLPNLYTRTLKTTDAAAQTYSVCVCVCLPLPRAFGDIVPLGQARMCFPLAVRFAALLNRSLVVNA
eukprot:TRINITY_DN5812_c1_g1_i1.p1 TRINITY_DN5812_c1_g1~~TRINITY_DN5812_c1_g1_i1.p1  ORF type:complete len:110 (-),score=6.25 TRINITY_DN5812_c1_g1_i1:87-416(-)